MRLASFRLETLALLGRHFQRGTIINRRQIARRLPLPPPVEFVFRLVARVKPAHAAQSLRRLVIQAHPLRLPDCQVGMNAEPCQIFRNPVGKGAG